MRRYFTWRCIGLHALVLVLVPAFIAAGWWQYGVARGGNDLSWVYTVEWPFFAGYALYLWWKLIHDRSTPFDRLWAAKQRAAADESGTPIHQIPGWATDKELSRTVRQAGIGVGRPPALVHTQTRALESAEQKSGRAAQDEPELGDEAAEDPEDAIDDASAVIDARVVAVKVDVDEELEAYNRYLFDLSLQDPPKRWASPRRRARSDGSPSQGEPRSQAPRAPQEGGRPELPQGGAAREHTQRR